MTDLKPGNMDIGVPNNDDLTGSMAISIDQELSRLLVAAGLPALNTDPADRDVRDRRRLFVAIARGVVIHLKANAAAISVGVGTTLPGTYVASVSAPSVP